MKIVKNIGAIVAGFLTVFILSIATDFVLESIHFFPGANHPEAYAWWMLCIALMYRSIYAIAGGYITAALSLNKPMKNVWILAIIGFIFATLGLVSNVDKGNIWYPLLLILLTIPSVWLGGKIKERR